MLSGVVEWFCSEITLRSHLIYISGLKGFSAVTLNKAQLVSSQSCAVAEEKLHTERFLTDRLFNKTGSSQKAVRSMGQLKMHRLLGPRQKLGNWISTRILPFLPFHGCRAG